MSHRNNTGGQEQALQVEDPWKEGGSTTEWETETDVMPPEYCQQLLKISRELMQAR
jgi:hypothetical protein